MTKLISKTLSPQKNWGGGGEALLAVIKIKFLWGDVLKFLHVSFLGIKISFISTIQKAIYTTNNPFRTTITTAL